MFDFLIEEIRLCAEGASSAIQSPDKTTRKDARLKAWARSKGITHPKALRTGQKKPKDSYGVRKKEADKDKWGHPSRFPVSDFEAKESVDMFQSLIEEVRYSVTSDLVEGGGSRRKKMKRQMDTIKARSHQGVFGKEAAGAASSAESPGRTDFGRDRDREHAKVMSRGIRKNQPTGDKLANRKKPAKILRGKRAGKIAADERPSGVPSDTWADKSQRWRYRGEYGRSVRKAYKDK